MAYGYHPLGARNTAIPLQVKPQRQFLGFPDANTPRLHNLCISQLRSRGVAVGRPDLQWSIKQRHSVTHECNGKGFGQSCWPITEELALLGPTPLLHHGNTLERLQGSDQDRLSRSYLPGDGIDTMMHAVNKI